jgi:hypothetical protein
MLWKTFLSRLAARYVGRAAAEQRQPGNLLDLRLGATLLRDRRIPASRKLMALAIGFAITYALCAVEAPLEMVVGVLAPGLGTAAGLLLDGAEAIVCPMLFAALLLPHLAPQALAAEMRSSRQSLNRR